MPVLLTSWPKDSTTNTFLGPGAQVPRYLFKETMHLILNGFRLRELQDNIEPTGAVQSTLMINRCQPPLTFSTECCPGAIELYRGCSIAATPAFPGRSNLEQCSCLWPVQLLPAQVTFYCYPCPALPGVQLLLDHTSLNSPKARSEVSNFFLLPQHHSRDPSQPPIVLIHWLVVHRSSAYS